MSRSTESARHVATQCWDGLDFELEMPLDWSVQRPPMDHDIVDFEQEPAAMQSLLQARSSDGSLRIDIGARPFEAVLPLVYGTVYFLGEHDFELVDDGGEGRIDNHAAVLGLALHGQGPATQLIRYAYFADGRRIVEILLRGPQPRVAELMPVWRLVEASFRLLRPLGDPTDRQPEAEPEVVAPSWWDRAQALQQDGRIDEALALIRRECDLAGALLAQAELLARHMREALACGDIAEAASAHDRATRLACAYAGSATSGGEGAALSIERDRFLAELGPAPGA